MGLLAGAVLALPFLLAVQERAKVGSHLTIIDRDGTSKRVVYSSERLSEAQNWSPDGQHLVFNSEGKLWRIPVAGGEPKPIPLGRVTGITNDHGISPDGSEIVVSAGQIYVLPFAGGEPRQVTEKSPSYFHGWSPDGQALVYCAPRDRNFDIYRIPVGGGPEERLTTHPAYDDGPEYSSDGKWIYWNSNRSGSWDIRRMPAAGAGPNDERAERITSDELDDWFPHSSPDGKWIVFLSFPKGTEGHPANRNVVLRIMPAPPLNVLSWAPDSRRFAYVSYELIE